MSQQVLSLFELNRFVKQALHNQLPDTYWVQAELSDVRSNSSGHCYLEFVQKDTGGNHLIAKARGTIWSNIFKMLKPYFEQETGQQFASGIKVLVQVSVEFHELYGYSLTVLDIDPTYTLGDMARRRREIILRLEEEGVLTMNKELDMPLLAQIPIDENISEANDKGTPFSFNGFSPVAAAFEKLAKKIVEMF